MKIANSKIYKDRTRELPVAILAKSLTLTKDEKEDLKTNVGSLKIIGAIDETIAKPTDGVQLIYLLELTPKGDEIPTVFMTAFDKQTVAHTIFEVPWRECKIYYMARKTIKDRKVSMGSYYGTDPKDELAVEINTGETLGDVYCNLYSFVVDLKRRNKERADDIEDRSKRIRELEKEVEKLERKKNTENQFNKKTQINEQIRALLAQIEGETNNG